MKIPKYIKKKMHRIVNLSSEMSIVEKEVVDYLSSKGIDVEEYCVPNGYGFEELSYGNDVVDELCERLEKDGEQE